MHEKKATPESSALLMTEEELGHARKGRSDKPSVLYLHDDDEEEDDSILYDKMSRKKTTSLLILDCFVTIIEILQFLAIVQSMALRWAWPESFLSATNFIFLFNLDIWDFLKVHTAGAYKHIQGYHVPSDSMPAYYFSLILGWSIILIVAVVVYVATYTRLRHRKHPFMMVRIARLQHVYIVMIQLFTLPVGVVAGRVFHCTDQNLVDIDNSITCSSGHHWIIMTTAIAFFVCVFLPFPIWLIYKTLQEIYVLWISRRKHEATLQLKEIQYRQGLNLTWVVKSYHIFASFARGSVHYRAVMHLFKLSVILVFSLAHNSIWTQAGLCLGIFSLMSLLLCLFRPFRVTSLNVLMVYCYLSLLGMSLYGTVMTSVSPTQVGSPWMLYPYNVWLLGVLTGLVALAILFFVVYAFTREIICYKHCCKEHMWPTLTRHGLSRLSPHTRKYMKALLRGQIFLEKVQKAPPMFARADELAKQIEVINVYCREAEYLGDIMHRPLLNLVDSMIQTHAYIYPKSLFSNSVKSSIQETAAKFMDLLPVFSRRLTQREYDFILVSPVKKRILLKMLCLAIFLNGRAEKVAKKKLTREAQAKMWQERPEIRVFEEPDVYYEDMYPDPQEELACRPDSALSDDDLSDEVRGHDLFTGSILEIDYIGESSTCQVDKTWPDPVPVDEEELPAYSLIDLRQGEITEGSPAQPEVTNSAQDETEVNNQGASNSRFQPDETGGDNLEQIRPQEKTEESRQPEIKGRTTQRKGPRKNMKKRKT
ncbi:uncharacterized protein LOC135481242 [Liolophura sinensis]|uniref:uncharacterized protein LOC135481242 n=1 Tax=Liolophura sinensis TaxID=3198878 RepID=UPI003158A7A9